MSEPDHIVRLKVEQAELEARIDKLVAFITDPAGIYVILTPGDRALLDIQLRAMQTYSSVLEARLR